MKTLLQDLKYAVRMLLDKPAFTLIALITLMLGIGANTAIFSVVNAVLLRALPYNEPDRIALVWGTSERDSTDRNQNSFTDIADVRAQNKVFEEIAAYTGWQPVLSGSGEAERVAAMQVGDGFFKVMKSEPLLGRVFTNEEQQEGKDFVVVLSYGLWQRRFNGNANIVGQTIQLNSRTYTIVGVMPKEFNSLPTNLINAPAELYRPVAESYDNTQRDARHLRAIARLKQGVTIEQAQTEIAGFAKRLQKDYPASNTDRGMRVVSLPDDTIGNLKRSLLLLTVAVGFVLLIACANVANLLLARGVTRQREVAIRAALGAGRTRLIRQFLTESLLLAFLGGVLGVLLAWWGVSVITSLGAQVFPLLSNVAISKTVLAFTFGISLLTGLLFGLIPALQISKPDLNRTLKDGGRASGVGHKRLRNGLVVAEIALSLVLLVCASLLIRSVIRLQQVSPGFNTENLLTMSIGLPQVKYKDAQQRVNFFKQLDERLANLPGLESAGVTSVLPLSKSFDGRGIQIEGQTFPQGQNPDADMYVVTPGYLRAMQIPLVSGRLFNSQDTADAPQVALVTQSFASKIWNNENPIGKRIRLDGDSAQQKWRTVVGVIGEVKQYGLKTAPPIQFYLPQEQMGFSFMSLVVRTKTDDPASFTSSVRREIFAIDKDLPAFNVATMSDLIGEQMALQRFVTLLLGFFATVALLLAAVGIYGVISFMVTQRTQEIGVRIALGAQMKDVLKIVLGQGLLLTFIGVALGLVVSFFLMNLTKTLLFGISPTDPLTFAVVSLFLMVVAFAACLIPARKAARTDPIIALKYE